MYKDNARFILNSDDSATIFIQGPDRAGVLRAVATTCSIRGVCIRSVFGVTEPESTGDNYKLSMRVHGRSVCVDALRWVVQCNPGLVVGTPQVAMQACAVPLVLVRAYPSRIGLVRDITGVIEYNFGQLLYFWGVSEPEYHRFNLRLFAMMPSSQAAEACLIALYRLGGYSVARDAA